MNDDTNGMNFEKMCNSVGLHSALLIESAIDMAYGDATRQGAFNTLAENGQNEINDAKKAAKEELRSEIVVIMKSSPDKYDDWQLHMMKKLVESFCNIRRKHTEEDAFTHGNAQKWVNMTMKYLWERNLLSTWSDYQIRELHLPIDSYILDALCFSSDNLTFPARADSKKTSSAEIKHYVRPSDHIKPWSKWTDTDYKQFRESLNSEQGFNLFWEQDAWLCASRYRSKQDDKNKFMDRLKQIPIKS